MRLCLIHLSVASKLFRKVLLEVKRLLLVDWTPLLKSRSKHEYQSQIDMHRVDMVTALAVRSGSDP